MKRAEPTPFSAIPQPVSLVVSLPLTPRKPQRPTKYALTTSSQRNFLISSVESSGMSIRKAAKLGGIKYSTAKSIMKPFRECGQAPRKNHTRTQASPLIHNIVTTVSMGSDEKNQVLSLPVVEPPRMSGEMRTTGWLEPGFWGRILSLHLV